MGKHDLGANNTTIDAATICSKQVEFNTKRQHATVGWRWWASCQVVRASDQDEMVSRDDSQVPSEMMDCHTHWYEHCNKPWVQSKLTDRHTNCYEHWNNSWIHDKLTSRSVESVGQAVEVRPDRRCRQPAFGVGFAGCGTAELARHPTTRGDSFLQDAEAGVPYSTANTSVVWYEGRRLLVSEDGDGKPAIVEISTGRGVSPSDGRATKDTTRTVGLCFGRDRATRSMRSLPISRICSWRRAV